jgi:hypothetical protein
MNSFESLSRSEFAEQLINAVSIDDMETVDAMLELGQHNDDETLLEVAAWGGSERMVRKFFPQPMNHCYNWHWATSPIHAALAAAVHGDHVHIVRILLEFMSEHKAITIKLEEDKILVQARRAGYYACSQNSLLQHMRWTPTRAIWVAACVLK